MLTCSKYHFEEKVLEKLIRLEHKMEIFNEKMKIWKDSISTKLSQFEDKMDSYDETTKHFKIQINNKIDIFEEQMSNMSQSLTSYSQQLKEAEQTRDNLIVQQREDFSKMMAKNDVIAFSAYRSLSQSLSTGTVVNFDKVWTNIGNGYNPNIGIFIAPRSGLYHFTSVVMSESKALYLRLFHNGAKISSSYMDGGFKTGLFDVLLSLEKRDTVSIKSTGTYTVHSSGGNYISFSGYIIK
ncbi:unnamed protein product [Mytilus coruscus]|uniref:C1q domain-containing protein n=1 Tax=Mytilus coruscus TaxID=42192 RepID=A0A6J8BE97_MYTCO|nr:unnamed protein product [Mytilus coruscus]